MPKKIALLASGSGSNAENIVNYFQNRGIFEFPVIISNKKDAFVHERARKLNIPSITLNKSDFEDGEALLEHIKNYKIDYIVLAGFLLKIPRALVEAYPDRIINIHPALLPKFGGKGMFGMNVHRAVREANESTTGITIHYVNERYDEGNIIFQAQCPVTANDTPESIAEKVHVLEYEHFPAVVEQLWGNF